MAATATPDRPLWSFREPLMRFVSPDRNHRSLEIANDGETVALIELLPLEDSFWHRVITIIGPDGIVGTQRVDPQSRFPLRLVEVPVIAVWYRLNVLLDTYESFERIRDGLVTPHFSAFTRVISMDTGKVVSQSLSWRYLSLLILVYGVPVFVLVRWLISRRKTDVETIQPQTIGDTCRTHPALVYLNTGLVASVLIVFLMFWAMAEYWGAGWLPMLLLPWDVLETACFLCCQAMSYLIPGTVVITIIRRIAKLGRIDVVAPWLATLSLVVIAEMHEHTFFPASWSYAPHVPLWHYAPALRPIIDFLSS